MDSSKELDTYQVIRNCKVVKVAITISKYALDQSADVYADKIITTAVQVKYSSYIDVFTTSKKYIWIREQTHEANQKWEHHGIKVY